MGYIDNSEPDIQTLASEISEALRQKPDENRLFTEDELMRILDPHRREPSPFFRSLVRDGQEQVERKATAEQAVREGRLLLYDGY